MKKAFLFFLLIGSLPAFSQDKYYTEQYRPRYHFSPVTNWTNDPNGLVYNKGKYHLFYQHNPFGNKWGHMTWAHAVSKDLVHWGHLPIAIAEEKDTMIFSGTCVVDYNNTSGFGKPGTIPMVAIYTGHIENVNQSQHLAYSNDDGITWTKYNKNPILDLHQKDFRDPKVFWYDAKHYWVMSVMQPVDHIVEFYWSSNLKQWSRLSGFGPFGDTSGVWECPDLTQVPVEGSKTKKKWLLQLSVNGSMQYFVGEFDGVSFKNENPVNKIFRPDYGPDYYAAIAYNQLPAGHLPTAIGWVNNWNYANDIPTNPWKGAMSLPRTLSVKKINGEWILLQKPIDKLEKEEKGVYKEFKVGFNKLMQLPVHSQQFLLDCSISYNKTDTTGLRIAAGHGHYVEVGFDGTRNVLYLDRSKTANQSFSPAFAKMNRFEIPYVPAGPLQFKVFVDHSIVEVFVNGGERVFTAQFFPDEQDDGIEFFSTGKYAAGIGHCYVYSINATW